MSSTIREAREEIVRLFADDEALLRAVRHAVRNAVLTHKLAGNPVAASRDVKVILIRPEEIILPDEEELETTVGHSA